MNQSVFLCLVPFSHHLDVSQVSPPLLLHTLRLIFDPPLSSFFSLCMPFFLFCPSSQMRGISHLAERVISTFLLFPPLSFPLPSSLQCAHTSSPPFLCTMHRFSGIATVFISQGKAALSWDTPDYLLLSHKFSVPHCPVSFSHHSASFHAASYGTLISSP